MEGDMFVSAQQEAGRDDLDPEVIEREPDSRIIEEAPPSNLSTVRTFDPDAADEALEPPPAPVVLEKFVNPITREEGIKLAADFPDDNFQVKPTKDAAIWLSHPFLARRLNEVLGMGEWRLVTLDDPRVTDDRMVQPFALYIRGVLMASAYAGADKIENNEQSSWDNVMEHVKSNGLMRCCKRIGIGLQSWDGVFGARWKAKMCVEVTINGKKGSYGTWRRKDMPKFWNEVDPIRQPQAKQQSAPAQSSAQAQKPAPAGWEQIESITKHKSQTSDKSYWLISCRSGKKVVSWSDSQVKKIEENRAVDNAFRFKTAEGKNWIESVEWVGDVAR